MSINFEKLIHQLSTLVLEYRDEWTKSGNSFPVSSLSGRGFKIGGIEVRHPVVTAPLAGISDNTFRIFAKAFGSALNFTEMISGFGVHYKNEQTILLSFITDYERPCAVQIFGSEPDIMAEAACAMEEKADFIDINMGCPVPKVLKTKSGGFLLTDEKKVGSIISKVTSCIKKPLTVKIRLGWDKNSMNALKISRIAQDCGAAAITVHGRTVKQGFSGKASYELIKEIKQNIKIPVIASGDIFDSSGAMHILTDTGCDAVMIGRAAKGRPWVFSEILDGLVMDNNIRAPDDLLYSHYPSIDLKKNLSILYLKFLVHFLGEEKAVKEFRKHFIWIFKGTPKISQAKNELPEINDCKSFEKIIKSIS